MIIKIKFNNLIIKTLIYNMNFINFNRIIALFNMNMKITKNNFLIFKMNQKEIIKIIKIKLLS